MGLRGVFASAFAAAAAVSWGAAPAQPRLLIFSGQPEGVYRHDAIAWGIDLAKVLAPRGGLQLPPRSPVRTAPARGPATLHRARRGLGGLRYVLRLDGTTSIVPPARDRAHRVAGSRKDIVILPGGTDVGNPDAISRDASAGCRLFGILGGRLNPEKGGTHGKE